MLTEPLSSVTRDVQAVIELVASDKIEVNELKFSVNPLATLAKDVILPITPENDSVSVLKMLKKAEMSRIVERFPTRPVTVPRLPESPPTRLVNVPSVPVSPPRRPVIPLIPEVKPLRPEAAPPMPAALPAEELAPEILLRPPTPLNALALAPLCALPKTAAASHYLKKK